jgi:hypothetical protein
VSPSGSKIITTPHHGGPILVRSFPSLEIVRSVGPPPGEYWDFNAFFAGNMIVSAIKGQEERFVAIGPHGKIADLDQSEAIYLAAAGHGTWLAISQTTIQRRKMLRSDEEIPGQMALW